VEKWKTTYADSVVGDHDDGACVEVVDEIAEVIRHHLGLIGCLRCSPAPKQDHRWRSGPQQRQKRPEVSVTRDHHPLLFGGQPQERVVLSSLKPNSSVWNAS